VGRTLALVCGGVCRCWSGREGAGLSARFEGTLGSLGGLRDEEGFPDEGILRVFGGGFREEAGGFGVILVRAIRRTAKKTKRR